MFILNCSCAERHQHCTHVYLFIMANYTILSCGITHSRFSWCGAALISCLIDSYMHVVYAVQVEVPQTEQLLSQLEELSCSCRHLLSYTSAAKCFAGLINKRHLGVFGLLALLAESPLISTGLWLKAELFFISSSGESLDSSVQRTMHRVCSELDRPSSPCRSQAFTLMIWVRFTHCCLCQLKGRWIFQPEFVCICLTKYLVKPGTDFNKAVKK